MKRVVKTKDTKKSSTVPLLSKQTDRTLGWSDKMYSKIKL